MSIYNSSSSFFYATSTPTSPNNSFLHQDTKDMCFYSVPNNPAKGMILDPNYNFGTKIFSPSSTTISITTEENFQNMNSYLDDFEFEVSHYSNIEYDNDNDHNDSTNLFKSQNCSSELKLENLQQEKRKWQPEHCHGGYESLPAVAFADELFCDGKVMLLNPPPCHQYYNSNDNIIGKDLLSPKLSPRPSPRRSPTSPISPSSIFKLPFPRRSLWNDDFDPFMVALENVKEGKKHRRAWSMSPLRTCTQWDPQEFMDEEYLYSKSITVSSNKIREPNRLHNIVSQQFTKGDMKTPITYGSKSPIRLAEPKGVLFARRARMVKMDYKGPSGPNVTPTLPMLQGGENEGLDARAKTNGKKWQKIMSFVFKSSSIKKTSENEQKKSDQNVEFSRPKILKKLSFSSNKLAQTQCNEEKQISRVTKMTLVRYRPKLLLCMGYGAKYEK